MLSLLNSQVYKYKKSVADMAKLENILKTAMVTAGCLSLYFGMPTACSVEKSNKDYSKQNAMQKKEQEDKYNTENYEKIKEALEDYHKYWFGTASKKVIDTIEELENAEPAFNLDQLKVEMCPDLSNSATAYYRVIIEGEGRIYHARYKAILHKKKNKWKVGLTIDKV